MCSYPPTLPLFWLVKKIDKNSFVTSERDWDNTVNKTPGAMLSDEAKNQFTMQLLKAMVKSTDLKREERDGAGAMMYVYVTVEIAI